MSIPDEWPARYGGEVLDYQWDWTARLAEGETIANVEAVVIGAPDMVVENESTNSGVTTIWVSGGGDRAIRSSRIELTATTDSSPARTLVEVIRLPILAR